VLVLPAVQAHVHGMGGEGGDGHVGSPSSRSSAPGAGHGKVRRGRLWPRAGMLSPVPRVLPSERPYPTS
jgi:hypothetical protein